MTRRAFSDCFSSATGERRPVYRTAGGRSAGAGGIEPASGAPATLLCTMGYAMPRFVTRAEPNREAPAGAARGGDGEHGNEQRSTAQCEPRAASHRGVGAGEVN
ncbi:conserved hypothetical protein [Xenorhabdus cabanillasii JM26]|uniref:Uncharacterized protein n=1 Tax=Xenorhabdus cabanillasii JM26 TaxID=1427517 RepID=W1J1W1_9GAMM|nr:conserved hypothetical protein [Xenorhabdus cabanillasii JM26]